VLVGTREENGADDFAPKHMATPLGWDNYFGFVCTPRHATYQNIRRTSAFTVTYPRPTQVVLASLAASGRFEDDSKPSLAALPKRPAQTVSGAFVADGYLFFECELDRIVDGFGVNSLIAGRIVAAHVHPDALRISERDDNELFREMSLLAYLNPGRFAKIEDTYSFPFPTDFQR
jgi:flavin reductase (DIM6/NTAB) family NADH-FMN oxidoreductase RutF